MLLPESHSSDYSVALPSLAKLTLCAAAIQAACFSFPALAADNPVVEKTAYSDIISPDPSNPSNWVVNRGTDDPAKGPASISWRHGAATSTLTISASSGQTVKILGGEPLAAVLYYRANGANFTNKKTGELFQATKRNGFGFLAREGKMGSFINNGTIEGGFTGVRFDQTAITTIVNNGTIIGSIKGGNADRTWRSAGMEIMAQNIGSLENSGRIQGNTGLYLEDVWMKEIVNKSGGVIAGTGALSYDKVWNNKPGAANASPGAGISFGYNKVETIRLESGSKTTSQNAAGLFVGTQGNLSTLELQQDAELSGNWGVEVYQGKITTAKIDGLLKSTGGSAFYNHGTVQDLKITDNATIESTVGISNTGKFSTIDIANAATLNVDSAVVANSGVIGTADDQVALHIGADATQAKEALNNTGAITGAVAVENGGTLTNTATGIISGPIIAGSGTNTGASNLLAVDNRGKVNTSGQAADIHIENGGQVKVLNWGVGVTGNRVGDGQGIKVSGDNLNARSINVEKVQISSITGYQSGDIDFNNAVQNASGQALSGVTGKPTQDVEFDETLKQQYGLDGYYDQGSGYFTLWVNAVKGVGAQLAETLANRLNRRAMFVEAATADVSQTGYTHRMQDNQEWLTFVKPYTSYDKFDLSAGGTVKGHTTGILLGISNMYRNEHLFTLYLGYETTDDSADSLDFDMNTVYGGAKFARVFCTAGNAAYYGKAEAMLAHTSTDVTRSIGGQQFTGSADTFSYGGAVHIGMNYSLGKSSVFTPEIGVGYTGGRMGDFDINGNIAAVSYEHYDSHTSNIGYGDLSLKWFQKWGTIVNTLLGGGTRVNFNRDMDVSSNISGVQGSSTVKLPRSYQWVNASLILDVNSNLDLSFGYVDILDTNGSSHNMTAKLTYTF